VACSPWCHRFRFRCVRHATCEVRTRYAALSRHKYKCHQRCCTTQGIHRGRAVGASHTDIIDMRGRMWKKKASGPAPRKVKKRGGSSGQEQEEGGEGRGCAAGSGACERRPIRRPKSTWRAYCSRRSHSRPIDCAQWRSMHNSLWAVLRLPLSTSAMESSAAFKNDGAPPTKGRAPCAHAVCSARPAARPAHGPGARGARGAVPAAASP